MGDVQAELLGSKYWHSAMVVYSTTVGAEIQGFDWSDRFFDKSIPLLCQNGRYSRRIINKNNHICIQNCDIIENRIKVAAIPVGCAATGVMQPPISHLISKTDL